MIIKSVNFDGEEMRHRCCLDALLIMCLRDVITVHEYGELLNKLHKAYKEGKLKDETR